MIRVKTAPSNLPLSAHQRHVRAWTGISKCNAEFAQSDLSYSRTTDSIFNFLIFLSPAIITVHQKSQGPAEFCKNGRSLQEGKKHAQNPARSHSKPENETGVPQEVQSTLNNSITCTPLFSPDVSKCLILSHSCAANPSF